MQTNAHRSLGAALAACALLVACGGDNQTPQVDARHVDFDRTAMLANFGENILLPVYRSFDARAEALVERIDAHCQALGTEDEDARRDEARDAWREVMDAWQLAEIMLIGPAAMNQKTLRDRIYSWPLTSSCAVDQDVMLLYQDPAKYDNIGARLNNRRGLDALEYLLFAPSLESTCPPQVEPEGWRDLTDPERRAARCALAREAAADLSAQARIVLDAWEPDQGNYLAELAGAGAAGSAFPTPQAAVNVVSDAMFYLDSEVKDMKIGQPAGIVLNRCATVQEPCLEELESPHAQHSRNNVRANLIGFEMLFRGNAPGQDPDAAGALGFEDFLRAVGADDLADAMVRDITAAIEAIDAIDGSLSEALFSDYERVVASHSALKGITDNLKSQFLTVLGLDIPDSAAGDND